MTRFQTTGWQPQYTCGHFGETTATKQKVLDRCPTCGTTIRRVWRRSEPVEQPSKSRIYGSHER